MAFCAMFFLRFEHTALDITRNPPWIHYPEPYRLLNFEKDPNAPSDE